jgi:L-serine dehydratase
MRTSIFDLFYIGIGPSSSHTIGPMRAAKRFITNIESQGDIDKIATLNVSLYGSLALTGVGHHTDKALMLGLMGEEPETVDTHSANARIQQINDTGKLSLLGKKTISFYPKSDIHFLKRERLAHHTNGMRFIAMDHQGKRLSEETMYSIGGGCIMTQEDISKKLFAHIEQDAKVPNPFRSGKDLLDMCTLKNMTIADIMLENERHRYSQESIDAHIDGIWRVMKEAVDNGIKTEGILPGGLKVQRRAPDLFKQLMSSTIPAGGADILDWLSVFAIATNEENASGGRVVTAPTNGASGIIPAVLMYYDKFCKPLDKQALHTFFLTAGAIGFLYKENASISGAEMGCQGEVGVACSMAAAGLAALLGGTPALVECAAEIGMEHHLGLTCDPIKGLVQIPCIERNSMGAVKAVNAARLAIKRTDQKISLDRVIQTMKETGEDMKSKYKETSKGGLALHNVAC